LVFATLALGWRNGFARWICAGIGALVMAAPFLFSTTNAAAYLSDTLVGALVFGLAVCLKPEPGTAMLARMTGPDVPPGWSFNPSSWVQRMPIIALAFVGLFVSRYLAAYQMGHVDSVWDPFFAGAIADPKNGTQEIITSSVSQAWPVPDAALSGYTYILEILTGIVGSRALADDALAGAAFRSDDRAAGHRLDFVHHHPADRHRHLEHAGPDRGRGDAGADPVFHRRTAGYVVVPAPPHCRRQEPPAGVPVRRYR